MVMSLPPNIERSPLQRETYRQFGSDIEIKPAAKKAKKKPDERGKNDSGTE